MQTLARFSMLLLCSSFLMSQAQAPPQVSAQAPAQDASGLPSDDDLIRVPVNVVIAPTTVTDKVGDFVNGLQPGDFTLFDNNHAQKSTVDVNYRPISMVVAVQANNSVEEILPNIQHMGSVLDALVVGQAGEVAVIAFDHRIRTMLDFTPDSGKISDALKKITSGSSSSRLIDATTQGVRMLRSRPEERRRILLLISEKRDIASSGRLKEALNYATISNVTIYSVDISHLVASLTSHPMPGRPDPIPPGGQHIPGGGTETPNDIDQNYNIGNWVPAFEEVFNESKRPFVKNPVDTLTKLTGGTEFKFVTKTGLENALTQLGIELHSQYFLSYHPDDLSEAGYHNIRVEVDRSGLTIRTRPGYWVSGLQ
jgi:VWFA-related protein